MDLLLRDLARNVVLFAAATFLPRVGLLVLLPVYARHLTVAEMGALSLMVALAGLIAIVYRLGLDATLLRFHFEHENDLGRLYATFTGVSLAGSAALLVGTMAVFVPLFDELFAGLSFVPIGVLAIAVGAGNAFQFIPFAWMRARTEAGAYLAYTGASFVVATALSVWLVVVADLGIVGALLGQLSSAALTLAVVVAILVRLPRRRLDARLAGDALRFGLPLLPHSASAWVLNASDRWLLAMLLPLPTVAARAEVGVYWIGYQIAYAIALLAVAFQSVWLPMVYRQSAVDTGARLVSATFLVVICTLSAIALAVIASGRELIQLLAGAGYAGALPVVVIVSMASVAYGGYTVAVAVLLHARRTVTLAFITAGASVVNVLINVVAIPLFGIEGAAMATLVSNVAYVVMTVRAAKQTWPLRLDAVRITVVVVVALALGWALVSLADSVVLPLRLMAVAVYAAFAAVLARPALRLLSVSSRQREVGSAV